MGEGSGTGQSSHGGPPEQLDDQLEVRPEEWDPREVYFLMTGLVAPRPVAWVSTVSTQGVRNLAPHSYFNVMSHDPPYVVIGSTGRKDTLRNVEANPQLVVNLTTEHVIEEMNATAVDAPPGVDEFDLVGVTAAPSAVVRPPRVAEALAHLECEVERVDPLGVSFMLVCRVVHVHISPEIWRGSRVDPALMRPVQRYAGTTYGIGGDDLFRLHRPSWDEVPADATDRSWIPRR